MNIGIVQTRYYGSKEATLSAAVAEIEILAEAGAKVICLQELFNAPYFCVQQLESNFDLAEPLNGPTISNLRSVAKKLSVVLIAPFFELLRPGVYHNSAAVIDEVGELMGVYRKMHIPDDPLFFEKYYFAPGEEYKVFDTKYGKFSVLICWDQWFPEAARAVALAGAQTIFYPTAIGRLLSEPKDYGAAQLDAWKTIQRSHAIANGVFVVAVNRVGIEKSASGEGIEFFGSSFVSDPFGRLVLQSQADEEGSAAFLLDLSQVEATRRQWPFLRDRRIDSYKDIIKR